MTVFLWILIQFHVVIRLLSWLPFLTGMTFYLMRHASELMHVCMKKGCWGEGRYFEPVFFCSVLFIYHFRSGLDSFGDVLQPKQTTGGPRAPEGVRPAAAPAGGLLKGDLDSTLASLAQNLDMNGPKQAAVRK